MDLINFSDFTESLFIFDLDDTLVSSDSFYKLAIDYIKENSNIKELVDKSIDQLKINKKDLKYENDKIYILDPKEEITPKGNWFRKGKRIYLNIPNKFYFSDICLPNKLKDLSNLYNSVENKCIVTGRTSKMKTKVIKTISDLGLKTPKYGYHFYPGSNSSIEKLPEWKANIICKIIKSNNFEKAYFFDDNSKLVNKVNSIIKKELPDIKWKSFKIKD